MGTTDNPAPPALRSRILSEIARTPGLSRQQISARLGIVPATVGAHVKKLLDHGFIHEGSPTTRQTGRPSIPLRSAEDAREVIGVSIDAHTIVALAIGPDGVERKKLRRDIPASVVTAEVIVDLIHQLSDTPPLAIGVTVSGVVDDARGEVVLSAVMGWEHRSLGREIAALADCAVHIENDAIALTTRELTFGDEIPDDFLHLHLGDGVGMSIVRGRQVLRGLRHGSIEFGHISLDRNGNECRCGNRGCAQTVFGRRELEEACGGSLPGDTDAGSDVLRELENRGRALARGVGAVSTLLGIDAILVSGDTTRIWNLFDAAFRQGVAETTPTLGAPPSIHVRPWNESDAAAGAASIALSRHVDALT